MTSTSKTKGAALAVASLIAGVVMTAIALDMEADSRALTSAFRGPIASPVETGATMQPPVGEVNIGPITYVQPAERAPVVVRPSPVKPTCVPYWRELVQGPAGRRVAISCPGATVPTPPPRTRDRWAGLARLPSLEDLGEQLPRHGLEGGVPNRDEAFAAARAVANRLSGARVLGNARAAAAPTPPELPLENALGWRACAPERIAVNAPDGGGKC